MKEKKITTKKKKKNTKKKKKKTLQNSCLFMGAVLSLYVDFVAFKRRRALQRMLAKSKTAHPKEMN